jgi:hypothetical protein
MMYREIIAVCSQIHTKHINALCGQNVEFVQKMLGFEAVNGRCTERVLFLWAFTDCRHVYVAGK